MQQIKLMSKLGLALIAITAISVAVGIQASYNIQAADAQARIPNNSVRSETIVDGQVKTADLANEAVTSEKLADGVIPSGNTQPKLYTVEEAQTAHAHATTRVGVSCEEGDIPTGGGYSTTNHDVFFPESFPSQPSSGAHGWVVSATNNNDFNAGFKMKVICLDLTP